MNNDSYYKDKEKIYDAEVLESSPLDENIIVKILIRGGRIIAKPALEVLEMALDPFTPTQVRVSLMAALAYLIMPFDLFPDFMPLVGYSCLLYTSPSPRDGLLSRMPSSA